MYKKRTAGSIRRRGAVLAAVLLLGFAAAGAASIALTVANLCWSDMQALLARAARENSAADAMELSTRWFAGEAQNRSAEGLQTLFAGYAAEVPSAILQPLRQEMRSASVEVQILDQDYDAAFAAAADQLGLPRGRRAVLAVPSGDAEVLYEARRFEIRVTVTDPDAPVREHVLRRGLIVLYDASGGYFSCLDSYLKKR